MEDIGSKFTDETIEELEKRVRDIYDQAYREVSKKADRYFLKFQSKYHEMVARVEAGEIPKSDFKKWYTNQIIMNEHWNNLRTELATMLVHSDELAAAIISEQIPLVFLENYNYVAFWIEQQLGYSVGFELISTETVAQLITGVPILHIDPEKDLIWNEQHIQSAVLQAVLQGESAQHLSQRLRTVVDMDVGQAMRTARSTMNSAQNAGRQRLYEDGIKLGVKMQKQWLATHDSRTRHNHRILDGQIVDVDKPFKIGGVIEMMYPGDPNGPASEYYNCRCTTIVVNPRLDSNIINRITFEGDMTYEEWIDGKYKPKSNRRK